MAVVALRDEVRPRLAGHLVIELMREDVLPVEDANDLARDASVVGQRLDVDGVERWRGLRACRAAERHGCKQESHFFCLHKTFFLIFSRIARLQQLDDACALPWRVH